MSKDKKRTSIFSLSSSGESKDNVAASNGVAALSTSPKTDMLVQPPRLNRSSSSLSTAGSVNAYAPESIFERSVQDSGIFDPQAPPPIMNNKRSMSYTQKSRSSLSLKTGPFLKTEDYVAPALDAATQMLNNKNTDLDNIEMIYSNRRNSSVVGLNMALGRPFSLSRKNSTYSFSQPTPAATANPGAATSPVSPPKLNSSASSVSFYSYADMINNEESRRPAFKSSYSQGFIPTAQSAGLHSNTGSVKSKTGRSRAASSAKKRGFLISPESSDEEKEGKVLQNPTIASLQSEEEEDDTHSLISSSVGECLRRTRTELNG